MKSLLFRWVINTLALIVVVYVVPGVNVASIQNLLAGALVLGLLNAFVRPVVLFLTLPLTVLTLGLFTLVVNGLMFYLAAWLVKGLFVADFWSSFLAALVFSIVSFLLSLLIGRGE